MKKSDTKKWHDEMSRLGWQPVIEDGEVIQYRHPKTLNTINKNVFNTWMEMMIKGIDKS